MGEQARSRGDTAAMRRARWRTRLEVEENERVPLVIEVQKGREYDDGMLRYTGVRWSFRMPIPCWPTDLACHVGKIGK